MHNPQLSQLQSVSWLSRMLGIGPRFQGTVLQLLQLGYKCRIRLPLFISAGFVLCHIFSFYLPNVDIRVEVIEEEEAEEADGDDFEEESDSDIELQ